jgi:DNA repair protein RadC
MKRNYMVFESHALANAVTGQSCQAPVYELTVVRRRTEYRTITSLQSPQEVYRTFRERYEKLDREEFLVVLLDNKNRMVGYNVVSTGSLTAAVVHPREVFKAAVLANAASIILCHGHPSGDPAPSKEDIDITSRLRKAGEMMGIKVLDHVIIGEGQYFSFCTEGMF